MTEFYLITGFLGAGKTTFLKNFLPKLPKANIQLIINEFGSTGVDGSLLSDTSSNLQEICGGSIFCTCKLDRFEEAMNNCLEENPDIIIVEASGLSDPTNIRKVLEKYQDDGKLEYKGSICLVDAVRFHKVLETARVCKRQLMVADLILINKTDLVTKEKIEELKNLINMHVTLPEIHLTKFGEIDFSLEKIKQSISPSIEELSHRPDLTLQKMSVSVDKSMSKYELEIFIKQFAEETARIKGYVYLKEEGIVLVDCVGVMVSIKNSDIKNPPLGLNLLGVKGQNMRKALKQAISLYPNKVKML